MVDLKGDVRMILYHWLIAHLSCYPEDYTCNVSEELLSETLVHIAKRNYIANMISYRLT